MLNDIRLTVPQIRCILRGACGHFNDGLTRPQIARIAQVSPSMTGNLGPDSPEQIAACDRKYGKRSLYSYGLVRPWGLRGWSRLRDHRQGHRLRQCSA